MKKTLLCLSLLITAFKSEALPNDKFMFGKKEGPKMVVQNRILAKVNGKAISVVDVMKKMDLLFYKQFPQYASNPQAKMQFYQVNWKHIFQELVDKELILADAAELKMQVSQGDVRQEIETIFGPNVVSNLDKVGLTFEEAHEMIHSELILKRMVFARVNMKAMKSVTPKKIREAYEEMAKNDVKPDTYRYRVVSIRGDDPDENGALANLAYSFLVDEQTPVQDLQEKIQPGPKTKLTVSEEFTHAEKEISASYKEILTSLSSGTISKPEAQKSKNNAIVYRIFVLNEKKEGGAVPFSEVENKLKNQLLDEAVAKETEKYLNRLHKHFDVQESTLKVMIPDNFEPFALK